MLSKVQIPLIHHHTYAARQERRGTPRTLPERGAERLTRAGRPAARLAGRSALGRPQSPRNAALRDRSVLATEAHT